jgi:hypothetical protein
VDLWATREYRGFTVYAEHGDIHGVLVLMIAFNISNKRRMVATIATLCTFAVGDQTFVVSAQRWVPENRGGTRAIQRAPERGTPTANRAPTAHQSHPNSRPSGLL